MRHTGIDVIGDVPWGTHFCQFYETGQDLIETLVPYFKEGLEANEFCMWVTSEPLRVRQAKAALKAAVPDLEKRVRRGQIDILDYKNWYVPSGKFSAEEVLKGWADKLEAALAKGYEGLRLSGNTFWLEETDWDDFRKYEEAINSVIGQRRMLALCTYSLQKCGASEIVDVAANHEFALIKRRGRWETIESSGRQTLRKERDFSRAVLDTAGALVVVLDKEGRITRFNKACETLTGYSEAEVLGRVYADFLVPREDLAGIEKTWKSLQAGDFPNQHENYWAARDGSKRFIAWSNSAIVGPEGEILNIIGTGIDITERRLADEELRRTREHLENLLEYANAPIIVWGPDFRISRFNHAFERLTGLRANEVIGQLLDILFPETTRDESLRHIRRTLAGERWEVVEIPILRKDGTVRTVLWNSANIYDKDGSAITATIAQGQDITERKQAEEALRRHESTLRGVLDATQESIWLFSPDGRILMANGTALRRFGRPAEAVIGKHFTEVLPADLARTRLESLEKVVASNEPTESEDQRAGILFHHSWYPVRDDQGRVAGVACFSRDITGRRKAEEETRRLATFPLLNPEPVVEVDSAGCVCFVNPEAQRLFPGLQETGKDHPWFGRWSVLAEGFRSQAGRLPLREVRVGDRWYLQNMYFVPELQRLRIYGTDITLQKRAEEELRKHAKELETARNQAENEKLRLEAVMEALPIGVSILDSRGGVIKVNPSFERVWGGPAPKTRSVRDYAAYQAWWPETGTPVNPEEWAAAQAMLRGEPVTGQQFEIQRFDGSRAHIINSAAPVRDASGNIVGSAVAIQDITELRRSQEELRRLNRTLTALSHSNQALMHAKDEKEFLEEACQVIVRDCGQATVWIGYAENDEKKSVRPVAFAGFEDGYVEALEISWADNERGRGPTGTAIRTGQPCACVDMLTDPKFAPWRERAIARGYASSLVLPLLVDGRAFGAISIYFEKPGAVSDDEMRLLTELANDVAYGISSIRLREAHARAEKALRESEERLTTFAAATFEGIALTERGMILDCNNQFAEMAGRPAPELRGTPVEQLVAPEDRERVMANIRPNRESVIEHRMERPDGSRLTVEVHGRPSGGLRLSAVRDITERKIAEEALRQRTQELQQLTDTLEQRVRERTAELAEANELLQAEVTHSHFIEADLTKQKETLQTLIDNIPVMLCFFDAEGRAKLTNRQFERLLGWSTAEAEGLDIAPGRIRRKAAHTASADSPAEGIPGWQEYRLKTNEGASLESSWATVRLSDGGQIGIGLDMRERKAAEAERLRLAAAVEQAWEGMAIMDADGRIRYANSAFEETSGASRNEIVGQRYYGLLSGDDESRKPAEEAKKAVEAGKTWSAHLTRKGTEQLRELDIRISPIRDGSGNVINYLVVERDVTREVRLQQHLRQAQKLEALGTLAGGIAHDFNNILNPIFINTELVLLDAALDEESRRELELALRAAERGRDLVRQIITFSRQKEKERKPSRIGPVVKETMKFLRSTIPAPVEIREHIEPETGFILADPSQVHQIVMNLCNNSAYAMRERGGVLDVALAEVEVDVDMALRHPDIKPGPFLRLTITDTGTGMTPEVIERAFDPFFTTKKPGEGSGMGLAVVHGIVRDYEGAVTVYSEVGKGTTFNVFFPRVPAKDVETKETVEILPEGRERILLVDDEEAQVQSMRNMLKRLGHRVISKTDPEEALKAFRKDPDQFDLVITDQTMPKLTGAQLAEEILRVRPGLPVILCTGFSEKVDANGAHAMGIVGFLMKPFSIREMAAAINKAVKKE